MNKYNVAIDGPSGAGKGVSSKWLAKQLNFNFLDTGAMYRAIALYLVENNIDYNSLKIENLNNIDISFNEKNEICLFNKEVESKIRNQKIASAASNFSKLKIIRDFLEIKQKEILKNGSFIAEGRDIGTVIIPDAKIKIYLTASAEIRAKRRFKDLYVSNKNISYTDVLNDVIARDKQDKERENSPLIQADDAIFVDTSNMNIDEQNFLLLNLILEKIKK